MRTNLSSRLWTGLLVLTAFVLLLVVATPAAAQFAGPPIVTLIRQPSNFTFVTIAWRFGNGPNPDNFQMRGTRDGVPFGPIPLGDGGPGRLSRVGGLYRDWELTLNLGPSSAGTYTVQIIGERFGTGTFASPSSARFTLGNAPPPTDPPPPDPIPPGPVPPGGPPEPTGPPTRPVLSRPTVQGNRVTLTWAYNGPPVTGFEIIAEIQATGEVLRLLVDRDARFFFRDPVPSGNFIVSMRALQGTSASALSDTFIVPVGVNLGAGDLQVTLTWNSRADMDLHVVEPGGGHVYYANRQGTTARLDRDDTNGFGPENIFVEAGQAPIGGDYRIYIVHFGMSVPTVARIQVTVNAGTPDERTRVFSRQTATAGPGQSIEVAIANPSFNRIEPQASVGSALMDGEILEEEKIPNLP